MLSSRVALVACATALCVAPLVFGQDESRGDAQALPPSTAPAPILPLEAFFGEPAVAQLRISGDGSMIGFVAPRGDVPNIFVRSMRDGAPDGDARPVTASDVAISSWTFVPGGAIVYFVDPARDGHAQAWTIRADGTAARRLTPEANTNAELLAVDPDHAHEVLLRVNAREKSKRDVWRYDVRTGEGTMLFADDEQCLHAFVDATWTVRLVTTMRDDGSVLARIRDNASAPWQRFCEWSARDAMVSRVCGLSRDGSSVFVIDSARADTADMGGLWSANAVAEAAGQTWRAMAASARSEVLDVAFDVATGCPLMVSLDPNKPYWKCFNLAIEKDVATIRKLAAADMSFGNASDDSATMIVNFDFVEGPTEFWAYQRHSGAEGGTGAKIAVDCPAFVDQRQSRRYNEMAKTRDGLSLLVRRFFPLGYDVEHPTPLPTVIVIDSERRGDDTSLVRELRWLANRGYGAALVRVRGSPGFGVRFREKGTGEWRGAIADDVVDVARRFISTEISAPGRIAVLGHGFGGLAAMAACERAPELFACGVVIDAPWTDDASAAQLAHVVRPLCVAQMGRSDRAVPAAGGPVITYPTAGDAIGLTDAQARVAGFGRVEVFLREHLPPWPAGAAALEDLPR